MVNNKQFSDEVVEIAKQILQHPRYYRTIKKLPHFVIFLQETQKLKCKTLQESAWYVVNNISSIIKCATCGINPVTFNKETKKPRTYCSSKCVSQNQNIKDIKKNTFIEKYGVTTPLKTNLAKRRIFEKYGVENISQLQTVKDKKRQTFLKNKDQNLKRRKDAIIEKYGVENISQLQTVKDKKRQTFLKNYGVDNGRKDPKIKQKIRDTKIKKYGTFNNIQKQKETVKERYNVDNISQIQFVKDKIKKQTNEKYNVSHINLRHLTTEQYQLYNDKSWLYNEHIINKKSPTQIAIMLNLRVNTIINKLKYFDIPIIYYFTSSFENEVSDFIKSIIPDKITRNTRKIIYPYQLDIFIANKNIAFECDGIYWHSELVGKTLNYHLQKTELCLSKNIQLFHIFENEWILTPEIVKSKIRHILNQTTRSIFARKCNIELISNIDADNFYDKNHLQGKCNSSVNIGLFFQNELISAMSISHCRFSKKYQYELIRFCSKIDVNVVGAANKLFKFFIKTYNPYSIISYCDRRWSIGNVYKNLEFQFTHNSKPNYWYFKNNECVLYSRLKFQKHKLKKLLPIYDDEKTEVENMVNNKYNRIWDCGNSVWVWKSNRSIKQ